MELKQMNKSTCDVPVEDSYYEILLHYIRDTMVFTANGNSCCEKIHTINESNSTLSEYNTIRDIMVFHKNNIDVWKEKQTN